MYVFKFEETPAGDPDQSSGRAARGIERKVLAQGEGGFFVNSSRMPSGTRIEPHHHNHDELIIVLEGGCTIDGGAEISPYDAVVIPAEETYGFTVGNEGMRFAVIRAGEASVEFVS